MAKTKRKRSQGIKRRTRQFMVVLTPEDKGWYSVTCPALPGCHSQGKGIKQTMANIREAIELILEDMAEHGGAPPSEDTLLATVQV
jgi:antitoxin HicB